MKADKGLNLWQIQKQAKSCRLRAKSVELNEDKRPYFTLKSIPTVDMKLPERKAPSLKRTKRHVLPTPLSPNNITYNTSLLMSTCGFH